MSITVYEVEEIQKLCENVVAGTKIITCSPVLVRVDLKQNEVSRQLTVCLRFPENYPNQTILVEIKSRFLSEKFLFGLANLAESKAKGILGKPQGIFVLKFIAQYLRDNPLCVAYDEIVDLKKELGNDGNELLKLKQKSSSIQMKIKGGCYFYKVKAEIPDEYPQKCAVLKDQETNLPAVLLRYLNGQSKEIARQCVEPPLRLSKDKNAAPFQPTPSLFKSLKFCIEATKDFCDEQCPICDSKVLPNDPKDVVLEDSNDMSVERVYCGHLFHQGCLKQYLSVPPFPNGGKLCPAKKRHARSDRTFHLASTAGYNGKGEKKSLPLKHPNTNVQPNIHETCGFRLAHDRWVVNVKVAESRWAQKQARARELQEVVDFLQ